MRFGCEYAFYESLDRKVRSKSAAAPSRLEDRPEFPTLGRTVPKVGIGSSPKIDPGGDWKGLLFLLSLSEKEKGERGGRVEAIISEMRQVDIMYLQ